MSQLHDQLETILRQAVIEAFGNTFARTDPLLRPATQPQFGDYQANLAMSLARQLQQKPREVAQQIVNALPRNLFEKVEIAGPGFINLTLSRSMLEHAIVGMAADDNLAVTPALLPRHVVVDYSCPNVAKEMHVGHLRSSVIGDAIVRVLTSLGHRVTRQNHLGDWGTQFGMLIEHLIDQGWTPDAGHAISDLNALYQAAKKRDDSDADFTQRARQRVVLLQSGDAATCKLWQALIDESKEHFNAVYQRLGVLLTDDDVRAESFYNDQLPQVVEALAQAGQLKQSDGAAVVYPQGFKDRNGDPMPMIVRKRDGGYLYATTDLAAARYRINVLKANRIVYVTDARQKDHFAMLFQTLRQAGWADESIQLEHVAFGTVLGPDKKPFKTREGDTVRLIDLIDEAEARALEVIEAKAAELDEQSRRQVAHIVGIGAMKYADLSSDRIKDYVFDWDRMLAMDGNTAPYLINAYVRIRSIFRKAAEQAVQVAQATDIEIRTTHPAERLLALKLLQFPSIVAAVAETLEPHRLCNYLYELASFYHQFYEQCPVLKAEDDITRRSRLHLCDLTARTLQRGLNLLGIQTVERM